MKENHRQIREYAKRINDRSRQRAIEEEKNESWCQILQELNIPHYIG